MREHEQIVMDEYLRERVEARKWTGSHAEHRVVPIASLFDVK